MSTHIFTSNLKVMASSEPYVCSLDEKSLQKAKDELNEDPNTREVTLSAFKDWIHRQRDWLKTPTDTIFLLSFLRKSKFSLIVAQEKLVNYWVGRQKYTEYFRDVDFSDPKLVHLLKSGIIYLLPNPDQHGSRVMMLRFDRVEDLIGNDNYTIQDLLKIIIALHELLLMDEGCQVNGHVWMADYSHMEWKHYAYQSEGSTTSIACILNVLPTTLRMCHFYKPCGAVLDAIMEMFVHIEERILKRIKMPETWDPVYEDIGTSPLPVEYLPAGYCGVHGGTEQELIDYTVEAMTQPNILAWFKRLSSDLYGVDESKRPGVLKGMVQMTSTILTSSLSK